MVPGPPLYPERNFEVPIHLPAPYFTIGSAESGIIFSPPLLPQKSQDLLVMPKKTIFIELLANMKAEQVKQH